jgi:hypothetical protein
MRAQLSDRVAYGKTQLERGLHWWEYSMFFDKRFRTPLSIVFAFVATHNHFVLDRGGKVFNRSAPVIKLPEGAGEDAHLELLGLLNSSAACFWMKQVFHNKGSQGVGEGVKTETWERFTEFDSTKLKQFPLPSGRPLALARLLDAAAQELAAVLPAAVAEREAPTRLVLDAAAERATALRARMVALQEELDWRCYALYGLVDEDLTFAVDRLPSIGKGERAFEIALARRMAAGEVTSSWFARHASTPITDLPAHWPAEYRDLVQQRLDLIDSDRGIRLLERPEYKRRWNWDDLADLQRDAQRTWLLDRIEALASAAADEPAVTTCARLADALAKDKDAVEVARDLGERAVSGGVAADRLGGAQARGVGADVGAAADRGRAGGAHAAGGGRPAAPVGGRARRRPQGGRGRRDPGAAEVRQGRLSVGGDLDAARQARRAQGALRRLPRNQGRGGHLAVGGLGRLGPPAAGPRAGRPLLGAQGRRGGGRGARAAARRRR